MSTINSAPNIILSIFSLSIFQVPETPIWLLSRGRRDDAVKALCWLRGWVEPDQVQSEFDEIVRYSKTCTLPPRVLEKFKEQLTVRNTRANEAITHNDNSSTMQTKDNVAEDNNFYSKSVEHYADNVMRDSQPNNNTNNFEDKLLDVEVSLKERIIDFCRPEMMKPMFLVTAFFFFLYGSGIWGIRPYMVPVFMELGFEIDPFLATVIIITVHYILLFSITVQYLVKTF